MKFLKPLSLLLLSLLMASCRQQPTANGSRNAPDDTLSLRVALLPTMGCLPLIYAVESGMAERMGLPLRYKLYRAQWDADTALLGKSVDVGYLDAARWDYYQQRGQLRAYTSLIPLTEHYRLLLGGHLRVRKMEQIKQRTIGAPRYTQQERYLHHLRDSLRFKQDDIYQPQINNFEIAARMLDNQQLDGLVLPEPWATQLLSMGHKSLTPTPVERPSALYARPFGKHQSLKAQQLKELQRLYAAAVKELNQHRSPLVDSLLTQRYHLTPEAATQLRLPRYRSLP